MAKVLLVDDNRITADLVAMVLEKNGHEFVYTADGGQALAAAKQNKPDLILLDVMLPGLDGYSIQSALLADEETRGIPVIVTTSKPGMEEVFKTAPNVVGFLAKPFVVKDFVAKLQNALSGKPAW